MEIEHGTTLRMARRCDRSKGLTCRPCREIINAYQREMRELYPEWNKKSNAKMSQRRKAMTILSYRHPEEFEKILQDVILKGN